MNDDRRRALEQRRCVAIALAVALGLVLAVTARSLAPSAVALAGVVVLAVVWWRRCRNGGPSGS